MQELYELKDKLMKELQNISKRDVSTNSLDFVDKLTHTLKNLDKVIESCDEEGYSSDGSYRMSRRSYNRYSNDGSYDDGSYEGSYARGRGRGARRDSMGRYSSDGYSGHGDMVEQLREMMQDAPDERTRMELQKFVQKMEQM